MRLGRPPEEIYPFDPLQADFDEIPMPRTVPRMAGNRLPADGQAPANPAVARKKREKCCRIEGGKRDAYYILSA